MSEKEEYSTVRLSLDVIDKLRALSAKSHLTQTEILTSFIDACYQIMTEGIEESDRISFASFVDLKTSSVRTMLAPILSFHQLPQFVQDYYQKLKEKEDAELRGEKQ
jgi:hypothetical protein